MLISLFFSKENHCFQKQKYLTVMKSLKVLRHLKRDNLKILRVFVVHLHLGHIHVHLITS